MTDKKERSGIDKFFDIAEEALNPLEAALGGGQPRRDDEPIDAEYREVWDEHYWANTLSNRLGEGWHCFPEGQLRAVCGSNFRSDEVVGRQKLEPGKKIIACTTCINMVARRG